MFRILKIHEFLGTATETLNTSPKAENFFISYLQMNVYTFWLFPIHYVVKIQERLQIFSRNSFIIKRVINFLKKHTESSNQTLG